MIKCDTVSKSRRNIFILHEWEVVCKWGIWYNFARHYTGADLHSDQREDNFHGKSCASPGGRTVGSGRVATIIE